MISPQERDVLCKNIERYEGRINHLYLDSRGYVTIGVGHLLSTVEAAMALPLVDAQGKAASDELIAQEYQAIKDQPANRVAHFYRPLTQLRLHDEDIDRLTEQHIDHFYHELKVIYDDFDRFPSEVKLATFDLIFNLGMTKLKNRWPKFNGYIAKGDWQGASTECRRRGIADERNNYVRDLLLKAAN